MTQTPLTNFDFDTDFPQVVVVGSANLDLVVPVPHAPKGGETILGGNIVRHAGGKGANQAVAASLAGGARTAFVGALGNDDAADFLLNSMNKSGVETAYIRRVHNSSGTAFISVDSSGENAIVVAPGANSEVEIGPVEAELIGKSQVVLAQLEIPIETVVAAAKARQDGALFMLNAAPSRALPDELWEQIDVLIVNEHEAADLASDVLKDAGDVSAQTTVEELASVLLRRVSVVVVTLGSQGCLVAESSGTEPIFTKIPSFKVNSVDTTGAGDTFCGVLAAAAALSPNTPLSDAALFASAAGALATTRHGAQTGVPTNDEVTLLRATYS